MKNIYSIIKMSFMTLIFTLQSCAVTDRSALTSNSQLNESTGNAASEKVVLPKEVESYFNGIKLDIERRWSRPSTAKNGQQAIIRLFLMPGGELVSAHVVKSSGDELFDQSTIAAVEKVGFFIVPSDPDIFDKYFRQFTILFKPEDLGR